LASLLIPVSLSKVSFSYKIQQFLSGLTFSQDYAHYSWRRIFSPIELKQLIKKEFIEKNDIDDPFWHFHKIANEVSDCHFLDRAMYVDLKTWMVDDILAKVDKATMASSLENRAPFLDYRIVEFCASLPVSLKINGLTTKFLLKKSQKKRLPREIIYRKKRGFNAPVGIWQSTILHDLMYKATTSTVLAEILDLDYVDKLWQDHLAGIADNGYKLFGITCLSVWIRNVRKLKEIA
jgi:asparagine synthase (glutamine-hydrolysing)